MPAADVLNWTTEASHFDNPREKSLFDVQVLVLAAIFVAIVAGNLPVVITIIFGRLGRTRMYYFILHLCFADLITGLFNVIPQLAWEMTREFHGGNILCKSVKFLQILGPYLSSYTLSVMSVDRFLAICYPLTNNHLSLNRAKQSILLAWILSLLFCVPQAIIFSYVKIPNESGMECWATFPFQPWGERLYVTWYAVSVFIVPFFIIFYTHFRICCELWKTSQQRRSTLRGDRRKMRAPSTATTYSNPAVECTRNPDRRISTSRSLEVNSKLLHEMSSEVSERETSNEAVQPLSVSRNSPSTRNMSSGAGGSISKSVEFVQIQTIDGSELIHASVDGKQRKASNTAVRGKSENVISLTRSSGQDEEHLRAKIKSVKLTVVVILCYVICSLPFIIVQLWANWYPAARESSYWTGNVFILRPFFPPTRY